MKITKSYLKQLIKEELSHIEEAAPPSRPLTPYQGDIPRPPPIKRASLEPSVGDIIKIIDEAKGYIAEGDLETAKSNFQDVVGMLQDKMDKMSRK